jgi:iron-sulfur cluster repair protein YtfE (RIC family)
MTLEIQTLAWDGHKNVAGLSKLMAMLTTSLNNWLFNDGNVNHPLLITGSSMMAMLTSSLNNWLFNDGNINHPLLINGSSTMAMLAILS